MRRVNMIFFGLIFLMAIGLYALSTTSFQTSPVISSGGGVFTSSGFKTVTALGELAGPPMASINLDTAYAGIIYINILKNKADKTPVSLIFDTGQYQFKSLTDGYTDTSYIVCYDKRGNVVKNLSFSVEMIYPSSYAGAVTADTVYHNGYYELKLNIPSEPGSYLFKVATSDNVLSKTMELETTERDFYNDKWMLFSPVLEGEQLYNYLTSLDNSSIYIWMPQEEKDEYGTKYKIPTSLDRGKAYWFKYRDETNETLTISPSGAKYEETELRLNLYEGWNQVGNPYSFYISWDSCEINGYSPSDAEQNGIIQNSVYWYVRKDGGKYGYVRTPDNISGIDAYLKPYYGGWLYANQDCELVYKGIPSIPEQSFLDTVPVKLAPKAHSKENWCIKFSCRTDKSFDDQIYLGVTPDAVDEYDNSDRFKAPSLMDYAELSFNHNNWNKPSPRFASDIRKPFENYKIWDMTLSSDLEYTEITINWDIVKGLPLNYKIFLEDSFENKIIDMQEENEYKVKTGKGRTLRNYSIKVSEGSLAAEMQHLSSVNESMSSYVSPNPVSSSDGAEFRISSKLGVPDNVSIEVFDIAGSKVAGLKAANRSELVWDCRNGRGNKVNSGVYLYIAKVAVAGQVKILKGKFGVIR